MNDPALYHKAEFLKSDIKNFFNEHKKAIHFRRDGCDSLLDIGCASGHITVDVISPLLPETFSRVIGVDINERMVCYANELFKSSKIFFEILDIGGDVTEFLSVHGCFDHITSSLCLHLLPDQVTTLKNISNLLHPNGDCLLYILVECFIFDVYVKMDKKWLKYMEDLDDYISPYYRKVNPEYLLRRNMRSAGFTQCEVKLRHQSLVFDNVQQFRGKTFSGRIEIR